MAKTLIYFDFVGNGSRRICMDLLAAAEKINNPALKDGVCCSRKELHSGFNTEITALKGGVLNPSARISGGSKVYALCINPASDDLTEIAGEFDYIVRVHDERIQPYDAENVSHIITEIHRAYDFDIILLPATYNGRAIAPRTAMQLKTGLTADVTDVGEGHLIRPAFDGKLLAGVANKEGIRPLMATIRPNVFKYTSGRGKNAELIDHCFAGFRQSRITFIESRAKPPSKDIRESRVLVSGGGGAAADFGKLDALAKALNGQVSAGRKLVDAGIADRAIQVGQSGKTVSPSLYIAIGIYGALQHVAGLKNARHIIAVNTDKYAPICSMADIVVEGDAVEFIEKLTGLLAHNK